MLARGPAGYRFTAKALQHAVPNATVRVGTLDETRHDAMQIVRAQCWVSGHLRGDGEPVEIPVDLELHLSEGVLQSANAVIAPAQVARLHEARRRA
jgi:hypothetical protein